MGRESMRPKISYATVPLATLLLVMVLYSVIHRLSGHANGLRVQMAEDTCGCYPGWSQIVVLHLLSGGGISINSEPTMQTRLASRLQTSYSTRAERILYLSAEDDIPFQRVAEAIDLVQGAQEENLQGLTIPKELQDPARRMNIQIRLITPKAVNKPCPVNCFNWTKQGLSISP
jgi:biopolymer transport protein ExbD